MMIDQILAAVAATPLGFGGPADIWASIIKDFSNITQPAAFAACVQVLMIDLVLAGDNAIVVGALAAGLPAEQRKKVIFIGVIAALVLRIIFALIVTQLMQIIGLILVGGLLLLWVSWRMWRDLRHQGESEGSPEVYGDEHSGLRPAKSFMGAACQRSAGVSRQSSSGRTAPGMWYENLTCARWGFASMSSMTLSFAVVPSGIALEVSVYVAAI